MSTPARLHKQPETTPFEAWILSHANIFVPLAIIVLILLIGWLLFTIAGVSAVESGNYYNHLKDVI